MPPYRKPIDLSTTKFLLKTVVDYLPQRSFCVGKDKKLRTLVDVGMVLFLPSKHIGKSVNMEALGGLCEGDTVENSDRSLFNCPLFVAPDCWTTGEALMKLGAFGTLPSAHQAGWVFTAPFGFDQHLVRIGGIKCCVGFYRPNNLQNFFE